MKQLQKQIRQDKLAYLRTGIKSDLLIRIERFNNGR